MDKLLDIVSAIIEAIVLLAIDYKRQVSAANKKED